MDVSNPHGILDHHHSTWSSSVCVRSRSRKDHATTPHTVYRTGEQDEPPSELPNARPNLVT